MTDADTNHMRHALSLAARGLGRVWPNPAVGCVIVNEGRIVGRGRTADGGRPHAETLALAQAGRLAKGATAYVTLEPCAHQGQTPPCAKALIENGIHRVVIACEDADPRVSGRGVAMLREAGVTVAMGCLSVEARNLQRGFFSRVNHNRPTLTLKLAMTLDGRIATASGESKWITSPEARRAVHGLRASHDAVMVGAGTVRTDNPDLRIRDLGLPHQPVRVVASRHLRLPQDSQLFATAKQTPVWIVCDDEARLSPDAERWENAGAKLIPVASSGTHLSPHATLEALGTQGLTRVFCEGGGMLAASLLTADLVDELIVFTAGKLIGAEGQPGVGPLGISALSEAPAFELVGVNRVGADVMQHWHRA
ncbi:Riboflavin biosynthesis protein RibD [Boseongicola aestuarii]|uniref:Riboflavin biosynthesis protein RibD n=2 Tax=Boseongicola aestuarii TaxID=1470561 RepID=A0A238J3B9_9RHOB|nr:bifunctional diaminohydroxyphosphoribosylaminopyrimidine deaminase/5-amino-6-(5-phosphoribosylamino)uracil reductase RibD [Boseongicola aestuarii]SMX24732.1 Riboflavin biosynthesis protein RibD [Boseongicola aestuarii]